MATISLTIPDAAVPRVLAAFGAKLDYYEGGPVRDATPAEVKELIRKYIVNVVKEHEELIAQQTARDAVQTVEVN